jgi:endonuclease VIII
VPEGDTVFRVAQRLTKAMAGQTLLRSDFRVPQFATVNLAGSVVGQTLSRGKHLLIPLGHLTLHTHLKMEGRWEVFDLRARGPKPRWHRPAHTARVVLATARSEAVGFALGVVELVPSETEPISVAALGPDLLGPDWDADLALANLARGPQRPIYAALLDQNNLAGIGNVYANELCFLLGVLPTRATAEVPLSRLLTVAHQMLTQNSTRNTRSTTGNLRRGETLWVYGRARQPCRRCHQVICSAVVDESNPNRRMFWCPHCQR